MNQSWFLSIFFILRSFISINAQTHIIASIQDTLHNPIPYSTVIINGQYGTIADSLGRFKVLDYNRNNSILIESTGFQTKQLGHFDLRTNPIIILNKLHQKDEPFVTKGTETIGYTGKGKLINNPITFNSNYEAGVIFPYPNRRSQIAKIKVHCGFKGSPILPIRINIYQLDTNGFPTKSILKKDIIFKPKEVISWYEFDISDQSISFPESGIAVTLEPLNASLNRKYFNKNYYFVISQFKPKKNPGMILRTDYAGNWFVWNKNPYAISLDLAY